jgi:hypothetical protein
MNMAKLAPPKDLRRHCRIPYDVPLDLEISWTANMETKSVQAKLINISLGGLRIEAPEPIPIRTLITFGAGAINLSGSALVCYMNQKDAKFIVGLELTPETRQGLIGVSLTD